MTAAALSAQVRDIKERRTLCDTYYSAPTLTHFVLTRIGKSFTTFWLVETLNVPSQPSFFTQTVRR